MRTAVVVEQTTARGRLGDLYVRHAPSLLRLAYSLTGDRDQAQDLVQDAFVRVAGRFRHLRHPDAFDAYLRKTIVNLFTSSLRRRRLEREFLKREGAAVRPGPPPDLLDERDRIWRALEQLPRRQRAAVVLRFYEDLSERQIAEVLSCSTGAAKALVAHGMSALRERIGDEEA